MCDYVMAESYKCSSTDRLECQQFVKCTFATRMCGKPQIGQIGLANHFNALNGVMSLCVDSLIKSNIFKKFNLFDHPII